jgi:hypothetical protein
LGVIFIEPREVLMNMTEDQFCSLFSIGAGEPLIATTGETHYFFLLEYNGVWNDKALDKSEIPEAVKSHLKNLTKELPYSKILLIKQVHHSKEQDIRFFVVVVKEQGSRLYRFQLSSYLELLDLDLIALSRCDPFFDPFLQKDPLYLVCTNGRRDQCCAKFGTKVYEKLNERVGDLAWKCSHVGGHRFAANFFVMPYGLLYGRMRPEKVDELLKYTIRGEIDLDSLRGRSLYPPVVQAAEYYLHCHTGDLGLAAFRLSEAEESKPGLWQVSFVHSMSNQEYSLKLTVNKSSQLVFESCAFDKQTPITRYSLITS